LRKKGDIVRQSWICIVLTAALGSFGCGGGVDTKVADPIDVTGTVTIGGQPATGVNLGLHPISQGVLPSGLECVDGQAKGKAIPGKYSYFFTTKDPKKLESIPEKYREPNMEHTIEISSSFQLAAE
jgi:hypothetical protein